MKIIMNNNADARVNISIQNKFIIKKSYLFIIFSIVIRILMDISYVYYFTDSWSYMGFIINVNFTKVFISYIGLFFLLVFLKNYNKAKFSHFLVILLFYVMYIPISSLYGLMNTSSVFFAYVYVSFLILIYGVFVIRTKEKTIEELEISPNVKYFSILSPLIIILSIYTLIAMTIQNVNHLNLASVINLSDVYEVRDLTTYKWGMNYLFSWQTKVINPYMIAINFKSNKKMSTLAFILLQVWLYVLTGHKMVLFTLLVIFIVIKYSSKLNDLPAFLSQGLFALSVASITELLIYGKSYLLDVVVRRVFYIPAMISNYYYDFFSENGLQYWRYSIFGKLFDLNVSFEREPSYIIGELYFGKINDNAVSGYLGSDYMNGGVIGIFLATIIIVILFKYIDHHLAKGNRDIVLITLVSPIYTLWNSELLTSLLTGGFFISLILLSWTRKSSVTNLVPVPSYKYQFIDK